MTQRHKDAHEIWHVGASNPRGVARTLVSAIDEACEEGHGSAGACDAAVQTILDQLCWLCGMPMPSLYMAADEWQSIENEVERRKAE